MKSTHTFSISFFLKKDKTKNGKAPLFARITIDGLFTDISTKQRLNIASWHQGKQMLSGNGVEEVMIREKMRLLVNDLNNAYNDLKHENQNLTAEAVKARIDGGGKEKCTLTFLFRYHNVELASLIEAGTLKNYFTTERYLLEFLVKKKKVKDIYLDDIDYKFITDFGIYMQTRKPDKGQKKCGNNTFMKHIERFKKVFGVASKNGWTMNQPFLHFERKIIHKDRDSLELEELDRIRDIEGLKIGEAIVRDIFVFCCFTGLAYCDVVSLNRKHLVKDIEGELWIEMARKKTRNYTQCKFNVFLLPEALQLIQKYKNHPASIQHGTIFPYYSNQTVNRYLKNISKAAGVNKDVTFHLARHTFATAITLENGVSMETVMHMLGHASMRTTQIYSKVKRRKILNDMTALRNRISTLLLKVV